MHTVISLQQLCLLYDVEEDGLEDRFRVRDVHSCEHGLLIVLFGKIV